MIILLNHLQLNSIFSYSSTNNSTDEELQKVFDKNKEIIVVYRASIKDIIPKKYIENIIPKEEFDISNDNRIKITIKYTQKNKSDILAEIYTPDGDLAVKTEDYRKVEWEGITNTAKPVIITIENAVNVSNVDWQMADRDEVLQTISYKGIAPKGEVRVHYSINWPTVGA